MSKALSLQPAVLARFCVPPNSDIDKMAGYWGRLADMQAMYPTLKMAVYRRKKD